VQRERQAVSEGRRAYVLVNNRTEGKCALDGAGTLPDAFKTINARPLSEPSLYFIFRHGRTACDTEASVPAQGFHGSPPYYSLTCGSGLLRSRSS
jgi:hypothetical protein